MPRNPERKFEPKNKEEDESKVVTKTGLTPEELRKGVRIEEGEKIYYLKEEKFNQIKEVRNQYLQKALLEKEGIGEYNQFDVDFGKIGGEIKRKRYEWNKSGIHEIVTWETGATKKEKEEKEPEEELGKARKEAESAFEEGGEKE